MQKVINILGIEYRIEECDLSGVGDDVLMGDVDYISQIIRLEEKLTPQKKNQVLLHEILHCICEELGLEIGDNEQIIQGLACALVMIFPQIISF